MGGGDPLPQTRIHPQHGYTPCAGAQTPPFLRPRSRKPFPQIKIYHYTPVVSQLDVSPLNGQDNYTEAILSNSTRKLIRFEIAKM